MLIAVWILTGIWWVMAVIAWSNAFLVPPVGKGSGKFGTVLIPARDEADNLARLLPQLMKEVHRVIVFDDGSADSTGEVAKSFGATVIRGDGNLPEGWTGKNHACWQLAKVAAEMSPDEWWLFLDSDTMVEEGFGGAVESTVRNMGAKYPVITAFPRMKSGRFPEPAYLVWVPWLLLSTIPFGLVHWLGRGHIKFTNGQFVLWKSDRYFDINPHEECKGEVLEDVKIGRLLGKRGVRVGTVRMGRVLSVKMYQDMGEAWRGMLKNSYWVTGHPVWCSVLALVLFGLAVVLFVSPVAALLALSVFCLTVVMTGMPWYCVLLFPLSVLAAGVTQIGSMLAVINGGVSWKGRKY